MTPKHIESTKIIHQFIQQKVIKAPL